MSSASKPTSWVKTAINNIIPTIPIGLATLALLGLAGVLGARVATGGAPPTFDFISIVIIFMAALTVAATIFVGLGLADKAEAFGLPGGSMRALLAIGVMILFVVFGLPMVSSDGKDALAPATTTVPSERLEEAVRVHQELGYRVRVLDYGTGGTPGTPARFQTFGRVDLRSAEEVDFGKQILTAIITLLTSVISFYFGSRSVADAAAAQPGRPGPANGGAASPHGGGSGGDGAGADLATSSARLRGEAEALDDRLAAAVERIGALKQIEQATPLPARATAIPALEAARSRVDADRQAIAKRLAAADAAASQGATAAPAEASRQRAIARKELASADELLKIARRDVGALETKLSDAETL